jgi:hypothetical protein
MDTETTNRRPVTRKRPRRSRCVRKAITAHMAQFDAAIAALRTWVESSEVSR